MKFSGVITIAKSEDYANGQGQRSKVKVTEAKSHLAVSGLSRFQFEVTIDDEIMQKACRC